MQVKAGRNRAGSQRYLCRACGRSYTPEPKAAGHDEIKRKMVLECYICCMGVRESARMAIVSTQAAANWIKAAVAEAKQEQEDETLDPGSFLSYVLAESERREYEEAAKMRRMLEREGRRWDREARRARKRKLSLGSNSKTF